jgi:uncharacterized membrane protein (DUF4010 family)
VILTRRHAAALWAIALWNVLSYANFARNLLAAHAAGEDRPTGYWVAHIVLVVVNLAIAVVLARWGWRAWRSAGSDDRDPTGLAA